MNCFHSTALNRRRPAAGTQSLAGTRSAGSGKIVAGSLRLDPLRGNVRALKYTDYESMASEFRRKNEKKVDAVIRGP